MTDMDPVPAATVVLVREASNLEILLLQRNTKLVFMGGTGYSLVVGSTNLITNIRKKIWNIPRL